MTGTPLKDRPRRKRSRLRKLRNATGRWLGTHMGAAAIKRLSKACHKIELGGEIRREVEAEHGALILAVWHGRGVLAAPFYDTESSTVLVSASSDGSMATKILDDLGYAIIRGSSSRHGVRALREMIKTLKSGKHIAITPDGPQGPMHSIGPGTAFLSRATGVPIMPVGFACDRAWHLKTWDRYTIPRPGARVVACYRRPLQVPRDATTADLADVSRRVREELREAEREAFAHLGLEPDWGDVPEWSPDWT